MSVRAIVAGLVVFTGSIFASSAKAEEGWATRAVNMRTCASVRCPKILTIPAGARVWVYYCDRWCRVRFAGRRGYAYGRYIEIAGYYRPPTIIIPPPIFRHPPIFHPPPRYRPPRRYRPVAPECPLPFPSECKPLPPVIRPGVPETIVPDDMDRDYPPNYRQPSDRFGPVYPPGNFLRRR